MKLLSPIALCCAAIVAFASCKKKEEDKNVIPKTKKQSLINGKWYWEHSSNYIIYNGDTSQSEDNIGDFDSCEHDDFIVYNADGTVSFDEVTKCEPDDEQSYRGGYWELIENDTKIKLFNLHEDWFYEDTIVADVLTLSDELLQIHYIYEFDSLGYSIYWETTDSYRNK
jgi:hypothetical protein